jgi:hypothetical protein
LTVLQFGTLFLHIKPAFRPACFLLMLSACPKNHAGGSPFRRIFRWQMLEHGLPVQLVAGDVSRRCLHWDFHVLRFRLDPQPSTPRSRHRLCRVLAETEFIGVNSQPSSHHVPNVIMDVPPWEILKLGPSNDGRAVVLAATSSLGPGAFLKWHPNQVPKVNHDVLCKDRQKVGDSETL